MTIRSSVNKAREAGKAGEAGEAGGEELTTNAQYFGLPRLRSAQVAQYKCPMPNAQCPMPHAQCPIPNTTITNFSQMIIVKTS